MTKEPRPRNPDVEIRWKVVATTGNRGESLAGHGAAFPPERAYFVRRQRAGESCGMNRRPPENLIGHPVSNAGKPFLHQEHRLDGRATPAPEEFRDDRDRELPRENRRCDALPPARRLLSNMKVDAPEHAGVVEHERVLFGDDHEMIVLAGDVIRRGDGELAAHPEVNPEPGVATETKQHLLRGGFRRFEGRTDQRAAEGRQVEFTEELLCIVREDAHDAFADGGLVPAFAVEFDFGELGHAGQSQ